MTFFVFLIEIFWVQILISQLSNCPQIKKKKKEEEEEESLVFHLLKKEKKEQLVWY